MPTTSSVSEVLASLPAHKRRALELPLDAKSRAHLIAMGNPLLRPRMSPGDAAPLIEAGYARMSHGGGYVLTDAGQFRALMEAP